MHPISTILSTALPWLLIAVLLVNLSQRRIGQAGWSKRFASLYLAMAVFGLYAASQAVMNSERIFGRQLGDAALLPIVGGIGWLLHRHRGKVFPFRLRCAGCGARLGADRFFLDDNRCADCAEKRDAAQEPRSDRL